MNTKNPTMRIIRSTILAIMLAVTPMAFGQTEAGQKPPTPEGVKEVLGEINRLAQSGETTSQAYEGVFEKIDELYANAELDDPEFRPKLLGLKGMIYQAIIKDPTAALEQYDRMIKEFPETETAKSTMGMVAQIKLQQKMVVGAEFPEFSFQDLNGDTINLSDYRGKVVLIDFWATWCGPCIAELPNVLTAYEKHHKAGFEIIGISLDKDKAKLESFIGDNKMDWPQYFDGKGWENELSTKFGITSIPATFLVDKEGRIIGKDFRGNELETAVGQALK